MFMVLQAVGLIAGCTKNLVRIPCESAEEVHESLPFNAAQVNELALLYSGIRERGLNTRLQRAVNLSTDLN